MQKTANDHVFFSILQLSVKFYRHKDKIFSQKGKMAQVWLT